MESLKMGLEEREIWRGQTFPFEKLAWLNVIGVPLHLAGKEVYDLIGSKYGTVIHHVDPQVGDGDISAGCIGVLRRDGAKIEEEVKLAWKDLTFSVWIKEAGGTWVPEGIGTVDRVEKMDEDDLDSESEGEDSFSVSSIRDEQQDLGNVRGVVEPPCMHGVGSQVGSPNENRAEVNIEFKGVEFGVVFPKKKKEKRRFKLKKRHPVSVVNPDHENFNDNARRSVSPRPRKRYRADDPFGLDEVIWEGTRVDLIRTAEVSEVGIGGNSNSLGVDQNLGEEARRSVDVEIKGTVEVGVAVGINLNGFEKEVEEAISGEGIEAVYQ